MVGNDIVDLNFAKMNSRWEEQRFLDKLFTDDEQAFIKKDDFRFQNIWQLWSMKESAYKIAARTKKVQIFNPKSFHCKPHSPTEGTVTFNNQVLKTSTVSHSNLIYTIAQTDATNCISACFLLESIKYFEQQKIVRQKAIQAYVDLKSISLKSISINKNNNGVPIFLIENSEQNTSLALTHHGKFGGFAILND
jgi:phosphopantetheinyl transferase (holo-ACP synthase)